MPNPAVPPCGNGGCQLPQGHAGGCNNQYRNCPTMGCTLREGHGGPCNANE